MTEKPNHHLKLVNTAARLFQRQGYSATGVSQIIKESGTPRGSFYYYFPNGKEELANETVRHTGEEIRLILEGAFANATSFSEGVDNITNKVASWFAKSGFTAGCPITAIHLEKTPENILLTKACQLVFASWVSTVEKYASSYGHEDKAAELAEAVIISLEGAWILARAQQSKQPFLVAAKMLRSLAH